jgi:hypothetical protein
MGGEGSSVDTSATQLKGAVEASSSDLSMSPPPPTPAFDFVINDAKGDGMQSSLFHFSTLFSRRGGNGRAFVYVHAGGYALRTASRAIDYC